MYRLLIALLQTLGKAASPSWSCVGLAMMFFSTVLLAVATSKQRWNILSPTMILHVMSFVCE